MDAPSALHPTDQTLSSFGLGKLDDGPAEAVNKHLEQCPDCRKRVSEMSADSFLDRVRDAQGAGKSTFGQSQTDGTQNPKARKTSAPPPADTLPPGLADHPDYEIKRELGRGGMGVVYLAHNTLMGRDEVLKVMGRQIMERPGVLDRFVREIRAVAKLRHPNIVTAYHATRLGESIVFAMEYVDGLDLSRMVKSKGPLPVGHACNFVYQSALGLQHAHEEGLVHRDIKPANLMLSRKGDKVTVKVLDFGLAKVTREEKVDGGLTSEGQALGTPDFIAPEQILDAPSADIRADIYSLGGTLYYLLTGRPPFKANSLYDMYQAHISRDADLLNFVRPEVPSELAALVAKMMAKDPNRRFQTPGEVAQALTPFFKKANAALKIPRTDVSQAGRMDAGRPVTERVSTPTQPATDAGGPAVPAKKTPEPTVAEGRWESLIDFRETERPADPTPAVAPTRRPPWVWPSVAVGVLMFGLFAAWMGGVFKVETKDGTIVVKDAPDDAEIYVDGEKKVTVHLKGDDTPVEISIPPGKHVVKVKKGELETSGEMVTVQVREKKEITVRFDSLVVAPSGEKEAADTPSVPSADDMTKTASGLRYQDLTVGKGERPASGQTCVVHYTGWLWQNGQKGKKFDSSVDRGQPAEFSLGGVIQGWTEGVSSMKVGGKRLLLIPPSLAYGNRGAGGVIPPNATLLFEVELLDLKSTTPPGQGAVATGGLATSVSEAGNPLVSKPVPPTDQGGFVSLFNGKDLSGWKTHPSQPGQWRVQSSVLIGSGPAASHLYSVRDDYKDFHLRVEARINDGGNSGVYFRSAFGPLWPSINPTWPDGYEAQINSTHWNQQDRTGSLRAGSDGVPVVIVRDAPVPLHQWFDLYVIAEGNRVVVMVNGRITAEYIDGNRLYTSGHIVLQSSSAMMQTDPQTVVEFRNIEIKELSGAGVTSVSPTSTVVSPTQTQAVNPTVSSATDSLQPGSVWVAEPGNFTFTILEREGERFKSKFMVGRQIREVNGTIKDGRLRWFARDVKAIAGKPGGDNEGEIKGDEVAMTWSDPGGPTLGRFTLRLTKPAPASPRAAGTGWLSLFNGSNLTGWKTHGSQPGDWRVENGLLIGSGPDVSHLYSDRGDYKDFRLVVEARINDSGNSGVYGRASFGPADRAKWPLGYEAAIDGHRGELMTTGSLYAGPRASMRGDLGAKVAPGQWFKLELRIEGTRVTILVNGQVTVDYFDERRLSDRGHIALQVNSPQTVVEFRRVEVMELNQASAGRGSR